MTNNIYHIACNTITRTLIPGILFLSVIETSCKNDPEQIKALTTKATVQLDTAKDVTIIYSEAGNVKAHLFTHEFIQNESAKPPYIDMLNGLKVDFYDSAGNWQSTLTARYARFYNLQGNVLARDSVQILSKKGEQLNTEELIWNQTAQKFFTEKPVRIKTATEILFGNGMEANQDFSRYSITNLKGTVQVNKNDVPN